MKRQRLSDRRNLLKRRKKVFSEIYEYACSNIRSGEGLSDLACEICRIIEEKEIWYVEELAKIESKLGMGKYNGRQFNV